MSYAADLRMDLDRRGSLLLPLAISVLFHGLFMFFFTILSHVPTPADSPFNVEILQPEDVARALTQPRSHEGEKAAPAPAEPAVAPPKNQIVSPPDSPEETPDKARLFSDRDSKTLEEIVKRGEPAPPAKPPQQTSKAEKAEHPSPKAPTKAKGETEGSDRRGDLKAPSEQQRTTVSGARVPSLGDLFVPPAELARDPALRKGESGGDEKTEQGGQRKFAAIERPELWADPGQRGTPDYLPDVKQGNFTLLNTKADRFAPFVRRVGLRVFQTFSMEFKQEIYAGSVPQGKENVEIEAVMSRDGKRVEVYLKQRSGNLATDRVLLGTLNDQIFFDENPPPAAVSEDGRIHFVFALNASVWYGHDENGHPQPGAHWIFGAGLL